MKYFIVEKLVPDTVLNFNAVPGGDKLTWVSPYPGIRQQTESSIANGYQSRYYTENDTNSVEAETGKVLLRREYLSLEGAQDMKAFLSLASSQAGSVSKILELWIETIDDNGNVTRID